MASRISGKSREILSKSGGVNYARAKRLRGAIVIVPFSIAVIMSFIYLRLKIPPLALQDFVVFSAPLLVGVVLYCNNWIYRFPAGAPLLALSLGGALSFPIVVCIHIPFYNIVDNGIGLALAVLAWGISAYFVWRLLQHPQDTFWNTVLEPFRSGPHRWVVIALVPLVWAGYAYGAFELVDTQFDAASGQVLRAPAIAHGGKVPHAIAGGSPTRMIGCVTMRPGFLGARWYRVAACPPLQSGL